MADPQTTDFAFLRRVAEANGFWHYIAPWSDEIERQRQVMAEAHGLLDERMGDTDPADPDDALLRAAQLLAEALP